ncbi:MAG: heme lyase CcmF/NrfE family subunit [Neisseriaceae bacterium]|nr:heme lyase CcmF/NrfE family subunit [Neisseriaceae bacterium]MBP6861424.1 heme lyase CcmF/NrfE family subunit [Neisseriaceae bacterium]
MSIQIGHFLLMQACVLALFLGSVGLWSGLRQNQLGMSMVKPLAWLLGASVGLSYVSLSLAFLNHDFSVQYVVTQSHTLLPWWYRLSAVWSGHEGSLLLWLVFLMGWLLAVCVCGRQLPWPVQVLVVSLLSWLALGMLLFILFTSNPFVRSTVVPLEGLGLNPLLQDIGLIIHPPLLYMGYVGFSVAFAFAITALLLGRLDASWAKYSRPWTMAAWSCLTLGILVGSIWAYYELGWGGWWFWDPVENASLMPWLAGTALMHSLAVTEKRGSFKRWTALLAILAFSLSLLGTFLVRSGVLTSVHAFATDPSRGVFILLFLALVVGGALLLYGWRAPQLSSSVRFGLWSREAGLLFNNVFLVAACASVLIGTLFPLVMDVVGGGKFSVGPPYFNRVFVPIMLAMLIFLGMTTFLPWRQPSSHLWRRRALQWAVVSVLVGGLLPWLMPQWRWGVAVAAALALWVGLTTLNAVWQRVHLTRHQRSWWRTVLNQPRAFLGMHLAHLGLAMFVLGAAWVSSYGLEEHKKIAPNETVSMAGYDIAFKHLEGKSGPNYQSLIGHFSVGHNGQLKAWLRPEKRQYVTGDQPMTESSVYHTVWADVSISLGEMLGSQPENSPWLVRIYYRPLMGLVWYGGLMMALGGLLALTDKRYRGRLGQGGRL